MCTCFWGTVHCSFWEVPGSICFSTYSRYYSKYVQKSEISSAPLHLKPNKWQLLMNVLVFRFIGTTATECEPQSIAHIHHFTHSWCWSFFVMPPAPSLVSFYFCYLQLVFLFSSETFWEKHQAKTCNTQTRAWLIILETPNPVSNPPPSPFLCWTGGNPGLPVLGPKPRRLTFSHRQILSVVHCFSKLFLSFLS